MGNYITAKAESLINQYGTSDPFELADALHITIIYKSYQKMKGLYTIINRCRYIAINENLSEEEQRIVCVHELGHDMLHRTLATSKALQEYVLYDMKDRPEFEANTFAAALLLRDEDVLKYIKEGYDIVQIASLLYTDINLLLVKLQNMNKDGYNIRIPYDVKHNFLK